MATGTISQEAVLKGCINPQANLFGSMTPQLSLSGLINVPSSIVPETEEKSVTPSSEIQEVTPSEGKYLSKVTVGKIPNNYGLITYNGFEITVS